MRERRGKFETQAHKGEGHLKMEADIGVTLPITKKYLKPSEDGRSKEIHFSRAFRGSMALPTH